jgi:SAM-dependent methyltransferase
VALLPEFSGERFVPGVPGEIVYEHVHRYAFASGLARDRRVLDAACGEGYGTALLAAVAGSVVGVDIDPAAVERARDYYRGVARARFVEGSVASLPLADASVDLVVSFETVEHLPATEQPRMIGEFARVLAPGGLLLLSSPNRVEYSDARNYRNPFHLHELDRDELVRLLDPRFPARRWYRQRIWLGSTLWSETPGGNHEAWAGNPAEVMGASLPPATYFVVIAARRDADLPSGLPAVSMFSDAEETELRRAEANAREVMRLDQLARELREGLDRQTAHLLHLERLAVERLAALDGQGERLRHLEGVVAERERVIAERERVIAERDRVIADHERFHWLLRLPGFRARRWWQKRRGNG